MRAGRNMQKYKPCPYCFCEIVDEPALDKHQGRFSIICPHCLSHRSEWTGTIEESIASWNSYMRDDNPNILGVLLKPAIN
jgi:hypothetical protein